MTFDLGLGRTRDHGYPLAISSMYGLGDTIYSRPFLRAWGAVAGPVYVRNPWPELLEDLPGLELCHPHGVGALRTQAKSAARHADRSWAQWPVTHQGITARYAVTGAGATILAELESQLPLNGEPLVMDLPAGIGSAFPSELLDVAKPIAVLRPVTYRREWVNTARPPKHEYVARAAELLSAAGYHVVSVADIDPPHEWIGEPIPIADTYYLRGELDTRQLLALVAGADVCVGGIGWLVPAALAARTPLVGICGGQGMWNAPEVVTDPRVDAPAAFVVPEPYCRCPENLHDCRKEIPAFDDQFGAALSLVTTRSYRDVAGLDVEPVVYA